ncbi:MAG TPA: mechanosensitive ion channel family protein [Candidatus Eisenbacteria bacterium]|nr:mechanosensitive ion channel family protein [Candidatus Eisenbacteria bacterium]
MSGTLDNLPSRFWDFAFAFAKSSLRIVLVLLAAYLALRLLRAAFNRLETVLVNAASARGGTPAAVLPRIRTLISVLWTIAVVVVWFIAVLIALGQVGLDITPVLAGAGIVGIAVGFGAQHLVRDLVSGFFLVLEDQIRVGDSAVINGTAGLVEAVSFRTVVLRDVSGTVHVFPNGAIQTLANTSKDWSASIVDVTVRYAEDPDLVIDVMRRVGSELKSDPAYGPVILEPPEVFGVEDFTESVVKIRARLRTQPQQQHLVGREYRLRLKKAFDAAGIGAQK